MVEAEDNAVMVDATSAKIVDAPRKSVALETAATPPASGMMDISMMGVDTSMAGLVTQAGVPTPGDEAPMVGTPLPPYILLPPKPTPGRSCA